MSKAAAAPAAEKEEEKAPEKELDAAELLEVRPPSPSPSPRAASRADKSARPDKKRRVQRFIAHRTPRVARTQEDDEFEEFEQQEWTAAHEDVEDPAMWQDGWEDDEDDEDFTAALRAELAKTEGQAPPTGTEAMVS